MVREAIESGADLRALAATWRLRSRGRRASALSRLRTPWRARRPSRGRHACLRRLLRPSSEEAPYAVVRGRISLTLVLCLVLAVNLHDERRAGPWTQRATRSRPGGNDEAYDQVWWIAFGTRRARAPRTGGVGRLRRRDPRSRRAVRRRRKPGRHVLHRELHARLRGYRMPSRRGRLRRGRGVHWARATLSAESLQAFGGVPPRCRAL